MDPLNGFHKRLIGISSMRCSQIRLQVAVGEENLPLSYSVGSTCISFKRMFVFFKQLAFRFSNSEISYSEILASVGSAAVAYLLGQ